VERSKSELPNNLSHTLEGYIRKEDKYSRVEGYIFGADGNFRGLRVECLRPAWP
jgi:hypothetical protein